MVRANPFPMHDLDVDAALRTILEGMAKETGERFDCIQDTSGIAKLSNDLRVQGVNFFARRGIYESYVSASPNAS